MPDPVALAQAGPVAILLVGISAMAAAFVKGAAVPGWLYKQERAQRERAEAQVVELTADLAALAKVAVANGKHP